MKQIGEVDYSEILADPRFKFQKGYFSEVIGPQLLVRCKNHFGLSIIHETMERGLFEAALLQFTGSEWKQYRVVLIEDDTFRFLTKDNLFSLMDQIERLDPNAIVKSLPV